MRIFFRVAVIIISAVLLGVGSFYYVANGALSFEPVGDGPWLSGLARASWSKNPYAEIRQARSGLWSLNRPEALSFIARTDDSGTKLTGRCQYRVSDFPMRGEWWRLAVYDEAFQPLENAARRHSFTSHGLYGRQLNPDILLTAQARPGLWIPVPENKAFIVMFQIYGPDPGWFDALEKVPLPHLLKEKCS